MTAARRQFVLPTATPLPQSSSLALILTLLACCLFSHASASPPLRSSSTRDTVDVLLPFDFPGPTIPPNFASFSLEPYSLPDWADRQPNPVSPIFLSLMRQLHPTPNSPGPTLRIGGNSGDMSMYNPTHAKRTAMPYGRQLWFDWTDSDVSRMGEVAEALNGKLVLGVNFRTPGDASVAIAQLQAVERLIGWQRIAAIEIGNEPDVYEWTQLRPANYSLLLYTQEWLYYAKALHAALPDMPGPILQGGSFGTLNWAADWNRYLSRARNYLKSFSFHYYPLSLCQGGTPTVNRLLSDYASQGVARQLLRSNALTSLRQYGLPLAVSEGAPVSCGRMPGVSNSFASALWAIDEMLVDASIGIQSWHFHYAGGNTTLTYSPLVRERRDSPQLTVMPIYYGLRFFALATANYSTVYRVNYTSSNNPHVKVYALISRHGNVQIVLIHKDATALHDTVVTLEVAVPVAFTQLPYARVVRLSASSATSVDGVRLGGYTYDGSEDGEVRGEGVEEWLQPLDGGYRVTVGRLTAVLLQLDPVGPYHMEAMSDAQEAGSALGVGERLPNMWPADNEAELSSVEDHTAALSLDAERLDTARDATDITTTISTTELPISTHEDRSIAAIVDSTNSQPPQLPAAPAEDAGLPAGFLRADESWKVRRGRWALVDAHAAYEQQVTAK